MNFTSIKNKDMIGDLMGNFGAQQEELKQQLDQFELKHIGPDDSIKVTLSASKKILDISIDRSKIDLQDEEQLEDLLLITLNEALDKADVIAAEKTQEIISEMLPPGFGSMFGM